MSNQEQKHWWQSKGIWGGILALVAAIAGILGATVEDQALLVESLSTIAAAIGGLLAIYGRIKADKSIGK